MAEEFKVDSAWAVRGIPEDVRRAVLARAKAEGRTVGAWVADALRRALEGDAIDAQLLDLRRRVEQLERDRCQS
jgi:plasmid stability protein